MFRVLSANDDKSKNFWLEKDRRLEQLQLLRADMHPKKYWVMAKKNTRVSM